VLADAGFVGCGDCDIALCLEGDRHQHKYVVTLGSVNLCSLQAPETAGDLCALAGRRALRVEMKSLRIHISPRKQQYSHVSHVIIQFVLETRLLIGSID
jgi:hypothetical protein